MKLPSSLPQDAGQAKYANALERDRSVSGGRVIRAIKVLPSGCKPFPRKSPDCLPAAEKDVGNHILFLLLFP